MKNRAIKIGFFGDGLWAHESFNRLITYEFVQISFVTVRWLNRDQTLMNLADKFGVPVELTENVNSDDFFDRIKQDSIDPIGSYCGMRQAGDELIDWNQSSRRIFNFVRAIAKPGPMATSILNDKRIRINKVREVKGVREYIGIPGRIIGRTDEGYYVKTKDTFIEMIEFEYDGRIRVGSRFLGGLNRENKLSHNRFCTCNEEAA